MNQPVLILDTLITCIGVGAPSTDLLFVAGDDLSEIISANGEGELIADVAFFLEPGCTADQRCQGHAY